MQMKIKIRSFLSPDLITAQSPSHSPPVLPARQMPYSAPLSRVDSFPVAVLDSHNRNTPSPAWGLRPGIAFTGLKSSRATLYMKVAGETVSVSFNAASVPLPVLLKRIHMMTFRPHSDNLG